MLLGAFLAALGAVHLGVAVGRVGARCLGGVLLGALHGWFAIVLRADQIVSGIAIVVLGLGLSSFLFRLTMGAAPSALPAFRALDLGSLSTLPLIGPVLFGQNILVYLTLLLALPLVRAGAHTARPRHPGVRRESGSRRSRRDQCQCGAFRLRAVWRRDGRDRRSLSWRSPRSTASSRTWSSGAGLSPLRVWSSAAGIRLAPSPRRSASA